MNLDEADFDEIERLFQELEREGGAILQEAIKGETLQYERSIMMRFVGQGAETDLPIERKPFNKWKKEEIRNLFDEIYKGLYGRTYLETPVEFVTFKVRAGLPERPFHIPLLEQKEGRLEDCIKGERPAFSLIKKEFVLFKVYDRYRLFSGAILEGPAIVEERESTIVIGEDAQGSVDEYGFVWISLIGD